MKRNKIYHLYYSDEYGVEKSKSTKCYLKSDALKFMANFVQGIGSKPLEKITFNNFKSLYMEHSAKRFSTSYQQFVFYAFDQFSRVINFSCYLDKVNSSDVSAFIQLKLSENAGERIINGYLRTLQAAFQRAVEYGYIKDNVFKLIKKLKPKTNHPAFPTLQEVGKIIKTEIDEQLKLLYLFAFYTGMRMGEIRFLKWSAIDFYHDSVKIENNQEFTTKSKRARIIPLHKQLKNELVKIKPPVDLSDRYIFHNKGNVLKKNYISHHFKAAVREAGVNEALHFHSLRHGHASHLIMQSVPIAFVRELLGHQSIQTTQIYAHLQKENLITAINKLPNI
jgi:integrase